MYKVDNFVLQSWLSIVIKWKKKHPSQRLGPIQVFCFERAPLKTETQGYCVV